MKNAITNSCGRRGCKVGIILPYDRKPGLVLSGMHGAEYDIQKILPLANLSLDKKSQEKEAMEKMAA